MNELTGIFKLLADESRLRTLMLLRQEDLCVCQLEGILEISQPRVSKYMSKFRDLGLVDDRRVDRYVYYHLNDRSALLIDALTSIEAVMDRYPQLVEDRKNLANKIEVSQCKY